MSDKSNRGVKFLPGDRVVGFITTYNGTVFAITKGPEGLIYHIKRDDKVSGSGIDDCWTSYAEDIRPEPEVKWVRDALRPGDVVTFDNDEFGWTIFRELTEEYEIFRVGRVRRYIAKSNVQVRAYSFVVGDFVQVCNGPVYEVTGVMYGAYGQPLNLGVKGDASMEQGIILPNYNSQNVVRMVRK